MTRFSQNMPTGSRDKICVDWRIVRKESFINMMVT
jgi:hypothetical protein